jgi:starvation-inducible DNA-binding protein
MKTNIGIPDKARKEVAAILAKLLADEYVLYSKTRNAHWNVTGPDFHAMHKFFEEQYDQTDESLDEIAERIRALGHDAPGSLAEMGKLARLKEMPGAGHRSGKFVEALLADHERIIRQLRDDAPKCAKLGDDGTNDFLVGLMEEHEKMAWMLRASLS